MLRAKHNKSSGSHEPKLLLNFLLSLFFFIRC